MPYELKSKYDRPSFGYYPGNTTYKSDYSKPYQFSDPLSNYSKVSKTNYLDKQYPQSTQNQVKKYDYPGYGKYYF